MTEMIISTTERPGTYDAIETAKPGEPLFPLQGGDPFAPPTILHWVELARRAGMKETDPEKAEKLLRKASDAEVVAWAFQAYQRGQEPAPENGRATYNERVAEELDETLTTRAARIVGAGQLNNALAVAQAVADKLAQLRACPEAEVKIREAVDLLRDAAFHVEPRRGNERS